MILLYPINNNDSFCEMNIYDIQNNDIFWMVNNIREINDISPDNTKENENDSKENENNAKENENDAKENENENNNTHTNTDDVLDFTILQSKVVNIIPTEKEINFINTIFDKNGMRQYRKNARRINRDAKRIRKADIIRGKFFEKMEKEKCHLTAKKEYLDSVSEVEVECRYGHISKITPRKFVSRSIGCLSCIFLK